VVGIVIKVKKGVVAESSTASKESQSANENMIILFPRK